MKTLADSLLQFQIYPRAPLKSLFTAASPDSLELLEQMVMFDPLKRPTALECLNHTYFTAMPRPTPPDKLPKDIKISKRKTDTSGCFILI